MDVFTISIEKTKPVLMGAVRGAVALAIVDFDWGAEWSAELLTRWLVIMRNWPSSPP